MANDAVSLASIFNHADSSLSRKDGDYTALAAERFDAGVTLESLGYIGYVYRNEVFIKASNDATNLFYLVNFKKDIPLNKQYDIEAYAEEYITYGLTYSKAFTVYQRENRCINIGLGLSFVRATDGQKANLHGTATSNGARDYDFELNLEYRYNRNVLYDYDVESYKGYGFNTYLAFELIYEDLDLRLIANDIGSKIYWQTLAYSSVVATSDNKEYGEDGYPKYQPAISGREGYKRYIQKISSRYELDINYQLASKTTLNVGSDYYQGIYFPYVGLEHSFWNDIYHYVSYEHYFNMLGLGTRYKGWDIEVKANTVNRPSAMGLVFSGSFTF